MRKLGMKRPSPAMVVAIMALCLSLVGTGIAASALTSSEKQQVRKIAGKVSNKKISLRESGLDVFSAKTTGNVLAVQVVNGCTGSNAGTGGIVATAVGSECQVTFPESIRLCAVVLGAQLDSPGGGEITYRKVSNTVVEVSRRDSAGGTTTAGAFSIAAICPAFH
jgi:hypothetical protein